MYLPGQDLAAFHGLGEPYRCSLYAMKGLLDVDQTNAYIYQQTKLKVIKKWFKFYEEIYFIKSLKLVIKGAEMGSVLLPAPLGPPPPKVYESPE